MRFNAPPAWAAATLLCASVVGLATARAEPTVTVSPESPQPGDAVLITVTDAAKPPRGKAGGKPLSFFAGRGGHQAVFAVPLDRAPGALTIRLRGGTPPRTIEIAERQFPEADVVVPEEYANPPPEARRRIGQDNRAIRRSFGKPASEPQFWREFRSPVKGERVTSPFGERRTFNGTAKSQHLGLDLAAREGAEVRTINDGTVVLVRDCFLPGNVVVVDHGAGIASAYFHLEETSVSEGEVLERGAVVGRAGQTGRATGPHVHLSVWVPGGFVDPGGFLRLAFLPRSPPPEADAAAEAAPRPPRKARSRASK
jgi:murein DD-endopeptidase MepM/ murein hydrolase activator NlpD